MTVLYVGDWVKRFPPGVSDNAMAKKAFERAGRKNEKITSRRGTPEETPKLPEGAAAGHQFVVWECDIASPTV